jgi:hypothetical protein
MEFLFVSPEFFSDTIVSLSRESKLASLRDCQELVDFFFGIIGSLFEIARWATFPGI